MGCPVITITADFTEFSASPSGIEVLVALSFDQQNFSNLNVQLVVAGQIFNSNNSSINTGFLENVTINEPINLTVTLTNSDNTVCLYEEVFTADQEIGDDIDAQEVYFLTTVVSGGVAQIEGCTDPEALNYNPNANISTDTCVYPDDDDGGVVEPPDIGEPVVYVEGCTNPLSVNYNPIAEINDGSCVFISGCTLAIADNYNPNAVVDDGSCECTSYNVLLDFSGGTDGYYVPTNSGNCTTVLSFDYTLEVTCEEIFDIFLMDTGQTLTDILNSFSVDFKVYDVDFNELYSKNIWKHDFDSEETNLYIKSDDFCNLLYQKLREENGIDCDIPIEDKYKLFRSKQEFIIPNITDKEVLFMLQLRNINAEHCLYIDNIMLTNFCELAVTECILIPKNFGFDLYKEVDNIKTSLQADDYILNTKELTLRVSPIDYINNDIIDYYNENAYYLREDKLYKLSEEEICDELIDVRNRQTVSSYIYHDYIHDNYINSMYTCSLLSKELDYCYVDEVYKRIDPVWFDLVNQFVPETSIRTSGHYFYKNIDLHKQKHEYRGYTLDKGCDGDAIADFEIITDDPCVKVLTYKSRFEQIVQSNNFCDDCQSSGVTYSYMDAGNNESGRLVQYSGDDITNIIETVNFETTGDLNDCECAATIEIVDTLVQDGLLLVFFATSNVEFSDINNITGSYDGTPMQLGAYDDGSQSGFFIVNGKPEETGEIVVSVVTQVCGEASDQISYERCEIILLPSIFVLNPLNPNFDVVYQFDIYGTTDPNDISIIVNGSPVAANDIQFVNGNTFSVAYTRSFFGNDLIEVTATMPCGTVTETVINNEQ